MNHADMTVIPPHEFNLVGDIPSGTTILEASAGAGKTYAVVSMAARLIADGLPITELLMITFSRAATEELRERIRIRLQDLVKELGQPEAARESPDVVTRHLAADDDEVVAVRLSRIARAVIDFDLATIATTHTFCRRMLDLQGVVSGYDPDATLIEDLDEIAVEAGRDIYIKGYAARARPPVTPAAATTIAKEAIRHRHARLSPGGEDNDPVSRHRVRFAEVVRDEVDRRTRRARICSYDDLQARLLDLLTDPDCGEIALRGIRSRFRMILVDEFQDTDPVQWEIVRRCFHGHRQLVLVGDPKQSIYAFRGAEVLAYLNAVTVANDHQVLGTNWRSDGDLVAAVGRLFHGCALGDERIVVHPIAAGRPGTRLASGNNDVVSAAPMRLKYLGRTGYGTLNKSGFPVVNAHRDAVCKDVAADISRLMMSGNTLCDNDDHHRPVLPGDVAVLVRTRSVIDRLQEYLADYGIPSVIGGGRSVFATEAATHWLWVLMAIEQPHRPDRVRLAALTPLLGYSTAELDEHGDDVVADIAALLVDLAKLFTEAGFAAMFERLARHSDIPGRLLALANGERLFTDIKHIAELCNSTVVADGRGMSGVVRWVSERIANPALGDQAAQNRRLDRDAHAVQIMTVHAAKGLEFPIVYVPFGWDSPRWPDSETFIYHDADGARVLDVGGEDAPGVADRRRVSEREDAAEELRLLYVAVTRARSQVTMYWAPSYRTQFSALHRVLFSEQVAGIDPELRIAVPADTAAESRLRQWCHDTRANAERVTSVDPVESAANRVASGSADKLVAAAFTRSVDWEWTRTSYSGLISEAVDAIGDTSDETYADEPRTDEPQNLDYSLVGPGNPELLTSPESLMNGLPFGAAFGTLVHEILEYVDTAATDLTKEVSERCRDALSRSHIDVDIDRLAAALLGVLRTPLGFGDLASVRPVDRLSEMDFELPLAGGASPGLLADLLDHYLPDGDDLRPYSRRLRAIGTRRLRGFLTGSIDSVLRVHDTAGAVNEGEPRYVVVDYKTNRLVSGDVTVAHFSRDAMAAEMIHAHYPLQALLYSVALHRYLRWRQPGYQPARHLGCVQYHFVRAMIGPQMPSGYGVFQWDIPPELVIEASALLGESA